MGTMTESSGARRINFLHSRQECMTLAAAASIVVQETRKAVPPIKFPDDPGDALSIAAGALARLVEIYAFDRASGRHTPIAPDALKACSTIASLSSLSVRRSDLGSALLLIRRSGLPFILAASCSKG